MIPGRAAGLDLQPVDRRAAASSAAMRIGLGVEHADVAGIARPVAARTFELRRSAANARGDAALLVRRVALIGARHLEQSDVAKAAIGIALRRRDQPRQQRGPHVRHVGGDRVGELQFRLAAAEKLGVLGRE